MSKSALAITEEHADLADSTIGQLNRLNSRAAARATLENGAAHPSEIWSAGKDLGWNGLALAEEHGGSGFGLAELAVVLEAHGLLLATTMRVPGRGPSHNSRSQRISVALAYRFSLSISRQRIAIAFKSFGVSGTSSMGGETFSRVRLYSEAMDVSALYGVSPVSSS